jgi:cytochrome c551/c552
MTSEPMNECITNCLECHRICTETVAPLLHGFADRCADAERASARA